MNVLYYMEPELDAGSRGGGVSMVACNLTRAMADKVTVTYFPSYVVSSQNYALNLFKVYSRFASRDFKIVHFNFNPVLKNGSYVLLRLARKMGAATLLNIHGIIQVEYLLDLPRTRHFRSAMEKTLIDTLRACKYVDQVVTYSEFMRNQIVKWYGVKREKIAVIPNGVNLKKFSNNIGKIFLEGDPAVLYVGYLSKFKSVDLLICALPKIRLQLPNLRLHIVGHGNQSYLQLLAKEKNVEEMVVFHGQASPEDTPRYYKSADFCVFPSTRDSFGLTLLEAMASGTPVIASNRGGTPEVIAQGKNGILFDPDDPNALAEAILSMGQDSNMRIRLSTIASKTVANYSWEKISESYVSLYRHLH
jgi:glycosyltransferase involved in cell wall biosynthesis